MHSVTQGYLEQRYSEAMAVTISRNRKIRVLSVLEKGRSSNCILLLVCRCVVSTQQHYLSDGYALGEFKSETVTVKQRGI